MSKKTLARNPRPNPSMRCGCPPCLAKYPGDRTPVPADEHTGSWEARYTDPQGKGRSKNWPTETAAIEFLEQTRTEMRQRTWLDPARSEITLCAWHRLWWPTQTGEETTLDRDSRSYRNHIEPHWGALKLYEFSWLGIQTWVNHLHDENGGPLAASSVVKVFQILDRMLEAAKRDRRMPFNPAEGVKLPKVKKKHPEDRRPPSYAQLWLIRSALPDYMHTLQIVAQETGLRWGELAGLRWCNVDLVRRVIHVREVLTEVRGRIRRKVYPKSDAGLRTVPITGLALRVLRELLADEPDASQTRSEPDDGLCVNELVFHGRNKVRRGSKKPGVSEGEPYRAPLRRSAFRRLWTKALENSGVGRKKTRKVTVEETDPMTGRTRKVQQERTEWWPAFHDQRHAFASRLHDRGVPEVIAQEILGHERAGKVTWLYTHAAADYAGQVLAALEEKKPGRAGTKKPLRLVA
ncbi:tyrosine-type recombinase/integrase [Streptomyces microflavus]|uniref:tyrosine-type recombinase/integrase n=1 Tax=Streptomyces microflavus TaxID=1919 RepID=UPI0033A3F98A